MQTTTAMVGNLSRAEVSEQVNLSRTINACNGGAPIPAPGPASTGPGARTRVDRPRRPDPRRPAPAA
jgi:hypothetical protein